MPELPEVETVRRGLLPYVAGKRVKSVVLHRPSLRFPIPADLPKKLKNRRLETIDRHGKTMLWRFENGYDLAWHLGMSGSFRTYEGVKPTLKKHDHIVMVMEDDTAIIFNDPRRFGFVIPAAGSYEGIDPYSAAFTLSRFQPLFKNRKTPIKTGLLDQTLVTGIGNIYACEALFEARIHPTVRACDLTKIQLEKLFHAVRKVLDKAVKSGGSSLRDHVMVNGEAGKFQHEFMVYGRAKQPCKVCDNPIQTIRQSGRSTFFCGFCQKLKKHGKTPVEKA